MALNPGLTKRVRDILPKDLIIEEKKMFRGITFMVNGKMCVSVGDDELMCRFDPTVHASIVEKPGCREMIHGGRTMKGFVFVSQDVLKTKKELAFWLKLSLDFNAAAKASKK